MGDNNKNITRDEGSTLNFGFMVLLYFVRLWGYSFRHGRCIVEGSKFMTKLPVLKKKYSYLNITVFNQFKCWNYSLTSLLIATNGKPLAVITKFPNAIGKLMIGKTLATNGEKITNAMIGNDVLEFYW